MHIAMLEGAPRHAGVALVGQATRGRCDLLRSQSISFHCRRGCARAWEKGPRKPSVSTHTKGPHRSCVLGQSRRPGALQSGRPSSHSLCADPEQSIARPGSRPRSRQPNDSAQTGTTPPRPAPKSCPERSANRTPWVPFDRALRGAPNSLLFGPRKAGSRLHATRHALEGVFSAPSPSPRNLVTLDCRIECGRQRLPVRLNVVTTMGS
jgi:hypothetical protein